jgi:hypothetical protein
MIKRTLKIFLLVIIVFYVNSVNAKANNLKWQGKSESRNGIKVMKNRGNPIFGEINLDLREDLCITYGKNKNDFFEWISRIEIDDEDNIYILDSSKCVIFKFSNQGKYLYKIGRKGEGPGEFRRLRDFFVNENGVIHVLDNRIIHILDNEGNYKNQIKLNQYVTDFFINLKNEIIISFRSYSGKRKERVVALLSADLKNIKKIASFFDGLQVRRKLDGKNISFFVENIYTPGLYFQRAFDGKCVFAYSSDYSINVVNANGEYILKIEKEEEGQPIPEEQKKAIYNRYAPYYEKKWSKMVLQEALQFPKFRPFFRRINVDEKGRIYITRLESVLKKKQKDSLVAHDVFNKQGYYIYRMGIPVIPGNIKNGYIYYIDENSESGDIKVKRFKIMNWQKLKLNK